MVIAPEKKKEIFKNWRALKASVAKADALVIEIMAHPDATANQIMEVHTRCVTAHKTLNEVRASLQKLNIESMWYTL